MPEITYHLRQAFAEGRVRVRWVASTRRIVPEVERQIEHTWADWQQKPGITLFDGPIARLEGWRVEGSDLQLDLSRTSYRVFLGTNLINPQVCREHGKQVAANPVGVSTLLQTADGHLVLGMRNDKVAFYPERLHPFAGSLEVRERIDIFTDARRELHEELGLLDADVYDLRLTGLAEDERLAHPEMILAARTVQELEKVVANVDVSEHTGHWSCPATPAAARAAAAGEPLLTPIAVAALRLWADDVEGKR